MHDSIVTSTKEGANRSTMTLTTGLLYVAPYFGTTQGMLGVIHSYSSTTPTAITGGSLPATHLSPMVEQHNTNYEHAGNEQIKTLKSHTEHLNIAF